MIEHFQIGTHGPGLYEFTRPVVAWVRQRGIDTGLLTLFIQHTSASLLIQENADAEVQTDLRAYFERLVPPSSHPDMSYLRHTYEGPDDMPAHIKAAMLPVSLSIPVQGGHLALGRGRASTSSNIEMPRIPARCCPFAEGLTSHDLGGAFHPYPNPSVMPIVVDKWAGRPTTEAENWIGGRPCAARFAEISTLR